MGLRTVGDALRAGAAEILGDCYRDRPGLQEELRQAAYAEAETLLQWVTGWSRTRLLTGQRDPLPESADAAYQAALAQRRRGEPLQYITGVAGFYGRDFRVRPGCLIPRPETEVLAEAAVAWLQTHNPTATVADLGTGSGILAITLKLECPGVRMAAVDISGAALAIAMENAHAQGADIAFVEADAIHWLQSPNLQGSLHLLVSNPPYIPSAEIAALDEEVRSWEPQTALDGGDDGLTFYRRLASLGDPAFHSGPAALFLEVGMGQAPAVAQLFAETYAARWQGWRFSILNDLRGVERVVRGERTV